MASPDRDQVAGFLMAIESTLDATDKLSALAGQLLAAQRVGKPLASSVLNYYSGTVGRFG